MTNMKPYRWWPSKYDHWSMLVFARNRKEAKIVGHRARPDGYMGDYLYCRVNALPMWREYLDQAESDGPHAIVSPKACDECGYWPASLCECRRLMNNSRPIYYIVIILSWASMVVRHMWGLIL